jgi:hypothetical protein
MKSYERDEEVNYADLESGSVDEVKGYGSCISSNCSQPNSVEFKLEIELKIVWEVQK